MNWVEIDPVPGATHTWVLEADDEVDDVIMFWDD